MKKIALYLCGFLAIVASMVAMTACSNEMEPETVYNEGMVNFSMTTSLPSELTSYATVGTSSAEGGIINLLDKEGYYVRYIMEVYPENSDVKSLRMIKYKELTSTSGVRNITFESRLLAAKYRFVFYADIVRKVTLSGGTPTGLEAACYGNQYFLSNMDEESDILYRPVYLGEAQEGSLQTIQPASQAYQQSYGHTSLEQYDVYTCKGDVDLRTVSSSSFTLKRPFAKVRIVTTDAQDKQLPSDMNWDKTEVSLSSSDTEKLNNTYNALTGISSQNGSSYYTTANKTNPKGTDTYTEESSSGERTLGVFYIPVSNASSNLDFKIWAYAGGTEILSNIPISVENVPLAANKLTTIKGNLLTKKHVSEITIDDVFDSPEDEIIIGKEASSLDELVHSLTGKNETITYSGRITKADGFEVNFDEIESNEVSTYSAENPLYKEGNDADITINFTSIENGAVLTFKGVNAPKTLRIKTGTKCSLRIDMENSDIFYGGNIYKYIITNAGSDGHINGTQYDAFFQAGNGDAFFSQDKSNSHLIALGSDFQLLSNSACTFATRHDGKKCTFISDVLTPWLNSNTDSSVWDFVGASATMK